jgi:hypothetical protein
MQKFLSWAERIVAIIFVIPFVVLLPTALIIANAETGLLNADTYQRALEKTNLYDRMPGLMAEQILINLNTDPCAENPVSCSTLDMQETPLDVCLRDGLGPEVVAEIINGEVSPNEDEQAVIDDCVRIHGLPNLKTEETPGYFKYLTVKDWESILQTLLPPEQIQNFAETTLGDAFAYLNGNSAKTRVSLLPLKERLRENGVEAMQQLIQAQPACASPAEVDTMQEWFSNSLESEIKLCNPNLVGMARLLPAIRAGLNSEVDTLPDEIPLFANADPRIQTRLANGRVVLRLFFLLPLFFLTLITLLRVRTLKSWLGWWGLPLALAGGLGMLMALFLGPLGQGIMQEALAVGPQNYDSHLAIALGEVAGALLEELTRPLSFQSLLIGLLGGGLWVGSFFAHKFDNQSEA